MHHLFGHGSQSQPDYINTFHIMRNLSSWGMQQVEIFMKKLSFSKIMYLAKHKGVADSAKKLKIPESLCLVRMNRKLFINQGINLKYFMKIIFFKQNVPC